MKTFPRTSQKRGSVLLIAIITITLISLIAISILGYSSFSYKSTQRKLRLAQVRLVASNDMEYLFYKWTLSCIDLTQNTVESSLGSGPNAVVDTTIDANPLNLATTGTLSSWVLAYNDSTPALPTVNYTRSIIDNKTPAQGQVYDATSTLTRTGNVRYWTARTRAWINDPALGLIEVRLGRHFTYQAVSACNGAVYYQGDLEFGSSGVLDIYGDIQSNGSIYMGTHAGGALNIHDKVYYVTNFNGQGALANGQADLSGTQYSILPSASSAYSSATFPDETDQVKRLKAPDNMVGLGSGTQASDVANKYPTAYPNGVNDVYRSVIAPPPVDSNGAAINEDSDVAANRMYNKAGLRITIGPGKQVTVVDPTTGTDPSNGQIAAAISAVRDPVYDNREQKIVNMTTIDMSKLTTAIDSAQDPSSGSTWSFNGVLYVYDNNAQTSDLNGIRIQNGGQTPNFAYNSNQSYLPSTGFTIASDNGVYVQGDYNTQTDGSSTPKVNNTAIMADAVTVLSQGWDDSKVNSVAQAASSSIDPAVGQAHYRGATADLTINSAILTGNTATQTIKDPITNAITGYAMDGSNPIVSGGVQNLVRYLEDWYAATDANGNGKGTRTTINGSLAQLFNSKYFNSHYYGTGAAINVYNAPVIRQLNFNSKLASDPPNGVPSSQINYYRGDLFQW